MVYEYVLAGVLVSLLGSVFFVIINNTLSENKRDVAIVSENGVCLAPEIEKSTDVVIVGAGVAGAALAYTLGKEGRRVHVIERDLSEPDRIVGELLQPGGYLKLIELGLEDCANESIDAQKVFGYALYKNGNDTKLSYPLETYSSDIAGRSFHNGRFIQRMRERAATLPNVKLEQGTVTTLIEERGTIKGVMYKNKAGEEMRTYAPLTIVCDGCFSNLRRSISTPNIENPSCFVGLILENCELPHANHGHVILGDPSPILFYPISSTEVRCLVDVPGTKVPSVANGEMAHYLKTVVAPQVPHQLLKAFLAAVDKGIIRTMQNKSMPAAPQPTPGAILLGDAFVVPTSLTTRTSRPSSPSVSKRSQSVDRKRPSTPTSPPSPSTPVQDSSADVQLSSRRTANGRMPEGLWPSTMRSLSVSFQSDSISIPVSKKEKPVTSALSDRTLRSSSNVAHRQAETPAAPRKLTPERKRSPVKGKNATDQSENSKPVDALHSRLIDQHRWPSRIGGKVSSNSLNRSVDLGAKIVRLAAPAPVVGLSTLRRTRPSDSSGKPLQKSTSDAAALLSLHQSGRAGLGASADGNSLQVSGPHKLASTSLSDRLSSTTHSLKSQSLPSTPSQSRPSSPSRSSMFASSVTRGLSPSRSRPSTPPSRGVSPSKARPSGTSSQSSSSTSVLSFIADFKGKKGASCIEDAHQLRLLYNRCLQWRFANARAEAVLYVQKLNAERTLLNVWNTTLSLWDSVIKKRIDLQQLKLELKLKSVLNDQMAYLDDWDLLESDHIAAFSGAMEDLEASTLRLPVTGGARADLDSLKVAICSAVDVMQAMASSICSLLSQVEGVNSLVSELAVVAAQEKAMLGECEVLLASAAAMQVEEYSLRTHLMQTKQDLARASGQFWQPRHLLDPD